MRRFENDFLEQQAVVYDNSNVPVIYLDTAFRVIYSNHAAQTYFMNLCSDEGLFQILDENMRREIREKLDSSCIAKIELPSRILYRSLIFVKTCDRDGNLVALRLQSEPTDGGSLRKSALAESSVKEAVRHEILAPSADVTVAVKMLRSKLKDRPEFNHYFDVIEQRSCKTLRTVTKMADLLDMTDNVQSENARIFELPQVAEEFAKRYGLPFECDGNMHACTVNMSVKLVLKIFSEIVIFLADMPNSGMSPRKVFITVGSDAKNLKVSFRRARVRSGIDDPFTVSMSENGITLNLFAVRDMCDKTDAVVKCILPEENRGVAEVEVLFRRAVGTPAELIMCEKEIDIESVIAMQLCFEDGYLRYVVSDTMKG